MTGKNKTVENALHITPAVSGKMTEAIRLWSNMYEDKSPWIKDESYSDPVKVVSLGLPAFIASEKARMVLIEFQSTITAKIDDANTIDSPVPLSGKQEKTKTETVNVSKTARAEYLNEQYQRKVINKLRQQLEYGIAKGGLVIKPYFVANSNTSNEKSNNSAQYKGELEFDYIQADNFYPLAFDASGKMTEAAFLQRKTDKEIIYTRLEYHKLQGDTVTVINKAFKNNAGGQSVSGGDLGQEISLTSVPEWANLQPETTIKNVDRLLFAYYKNPDANTIDTHSPLGVSAYSRAVSLIKEADKQYSRFLWEFEGGELAVDVDRDLLMEKMDENGNPIVTRPKMQQRLFRKVDSIEGNFYSVFNPPFRDTSLINGLNSILMRIEDVCALSRGTVADVSAEARTATELKILKQRTYASVNEMQIKSLKPALEDLVYIMDVYCTLYNIVGDAPYIGGKIDTSHIGKYEVSFEFDDSTITDIDTEINRRIALMNVGLTSKLEVRMWYFGETEEQAKEALQKIDEENAQSVKNDLMNGYEGEE